MIILAYLSTKLTALAHWAGGWSNPKLSDNRHWAVTTVLLSPNFGLLHPPAQCAENVNFVEKHAKIIKVLSVF